MDWNDYKADTYGCVITFPTGMTEGEVKKIIFDLYNDGKIKELPRLNSFDSRFDCPVFYLP